MSQARFGNRVAFTILLKTRIVSAPWNWELYDDDAMTEVLH